MNFIKKICKQEIKLGVVVSIILTLAYMYGDVVVYDVNITFFQCIKYLCIFFLYYLLINVISYCSANNTSINICKKISIDFSNYRTILLIIFICYIPHLILKYPMGFWYDEYIQLNQGLGLMELSTHFPLLYTYILTFFYRFGELIGDHNIGIFILSIIKCFITSCIFAYVITTLNKLNTNKTLLIISLLFFCFSPFIMGSIGSSTKDIYYSSYVVLVCVQLYKYVKFDKEFWKNKKDIALLFIASLATVLTRKNGIYIIAPTYICIGIREINNYKQWKIAVFLLLSIASFVIIYNVIDSNPKAQKGSIVEALSIPFQQTARFVKYHGDLVTNDEKIIIDKILDYDNLSELYIEDTSDLVKYYSRKNFTNDDLIAYFGVWIKQFIRSPITYIEATARQNIYIIYPGKNIYKYTIECNAGFLNGEDQSEGLLQTPIFIKEKLQPLYWSFLNAFHDFPIIELFNNMAMFIIVLIISCILIIRRNENIRLIVLIPLLITILIIIAGPTIRPSPRYAYPIIYSFPIWISLLFDKDIKNNKM